MGAIRLWDISKPAADLKRCSANFPPLRIYRSKFVVWKILEEIHGET